jgi:hypothetical protein
LFQDSTVLLYKIPLMKQIFFIFILLCISNLGFGQANLEVTLLAEDGSSPVKGDTVFIDNPSINFHNFAVTNQYGRVVFKSLPTAGLYFVYTRTKDGMIAAEEKDVTLGTHTDMSLVLIKEPVEISGAVIKSDKNVRINTHDAAVMSEIKSKELSEIPVEARDLLRSLVRLPHVASATGFFPEAALVSINGGNGASTAYLLEGMDNSERVFGGAKYPMATSLAQDVKVMTNNYSVEYGNAMNGVVNITMRSGTNSHVGELGVITRLGALDGQTPFAKRDLSGNIVPENLSRYQLSYGAGGAFKKDKFFYYVGSEHAYEVKNNRLYIPQLSINTVANNVSRNNVFSSRLDYLWNKKWRTSFMMSWGLYHIDKQGGGAEGGLELPSAASIMDRSSMNYAFKNTFTNEKNFSSETNVQFSYFDWNYDRAKVKGSNPQVTITDTTGRALAILGHPGYLFRSTESTVQFQEKLNWYLLRHRVKAGVEITKSFFNFRGGSNEFGNYTIEMNPAQLAALATRNLGEKLNFGDLPANSKVTNYEMELRSKAFQGGQTIFSGYVEDAFSVTKSAVLTGGVRYDFDDLSYGAGKKGDFDNIAPRLSLNIKLNEASAIRGGAGIFYDRIPYRVYLEAQYKNTNSADFEKQLNLLKQSGNISSDADTREMTYEGNALINLQNTPYNTPQNAENYKSQRETLFTNEVRVLNPNGYQNPYTYQFSLGYQYQINKTHLFGIDFVHNQGYNLLRLRDLNAPKAYAGNTPQSVKDADASRPTSILYDAQNQPFTMAGADTLRGIARNILMSETKGNSFYYGMNFTYQKERGDDKYAYRLAYTLSRLTNNTDDPNFRATDDNDFEKEWGLGMNDRTHVLSLLAYYYPIKHVSFSFGSLVQSGQPINRVSPYDRNGDGNSITPQPYLANAKAIINPDRELGVSRNDERLPWAYTFDFGAQYDWYYKGYSISKPKKPYNYHVTFRLDVVNILNTANTSGYTANSLWSNQIQTGSVGSATQIRSYSPPRQIQFTAMWRW